MTASQASTDFFWQLEGHVYQGYRDHREATELHPRLQDFLSVKDGSPTQISGIPAVASATGMLHQQRKFLTTPTALDSVGICMSCW